jgi:hypothetical protein
MDCHAEQKGEVGDFQETWVRLTDRDWKKNKDVRKVEGLKLVAGFSVQRGLSV